MSQKALIVEDDQGVSFMISILLKKHDIDSDVAINGKDALEKIIKNNDYSVITLDLAMPVMTGWEFLEATGEEIHRKTYVFSAYTDERLDKYNLGGMCDKGTIKVKDLVKELEGIITKNGSSARRQPDIKPVARTAA